MNYELNLKRKLYYSKIYALFEIIKAMENREVIFMDKTNNHNIVRCLNPRTIDNLKKLFNNFGGFFDNDKNYNIYVSVAKYKSIPMFTFNLKERSKFTSEWFHNMAKKELFDYDLFLDFDLNSAKTIKRLLDDTYKMLTFLDLENIRHNFYYSGSGFHINIQTNLIPNFETLNFYRLTKSIKERFNLKSLDLKGIGSITKFRKCEYTLVDDKIVFPLYDKGLLKMFNPKYFDSSYILNNKKIQNRGLRYRNSRLLDKEFINQYNLDFY